MKVLLFDNYDSFTYNLLHILKELGADVEVHRNDKISLDEVERFDKILLSPGSGHPGGGRHPAAVDPPLCTDQEHLRRLPRRASYRGSIRCNAYQPDGCAPRGLFGYTGESGRPVVCRPGIRFPCRPLPFVGRLKREFPRLPGDHGGRYGGRTDNGTPPSRI